MMKRIKSTFAPVEKRRDSKLQPRITPDDLQRDIDNAKQYLSTEAVSGDAYLKGYWTGKLNVYEEMLAVVGGPLGEEP